MSDTAQAPLGKKVDVVASARELAVFLKENPSCSERELVEQGDRLLAFFEDPNFSDSFQNMRSVKQEILEMAIHDVSSGVMTLRSASLGIAFRGRSLATFVSPHGTNPSGTVVFSLNWKNLKAFQNWRHGNDDGDVSQDDINVAIYRLTVALAQVL